MTNDLTDNEINALHYLGEEMCNEMIKCAAFADDAESWGITDPRVNHAVIDAWIAIVQEFDDAYQTLVAGDVLLCSHPVCVRLSSHPERS